MKSHNTTAVVIFTILLLCINVTAGPGSSGIWIQPKSETIFKTSFESKQTSELPVGYKLHQEISSQRGKVISGEISKPNQALKYLIPFKDMGNRRLTLSFFARSPERVRCAIWITQEGEKRKSAFQIDKLPKEWKRFQTSYVVPTDAPGVIELVAPSSFGSLPGQAFLDDIKVVADPETGPWMEDPEDFPALCSDKTNGLWLAVTTRDAAGPQLRLYNIKGEKRTLSFTFKPDGITGIGTPDIVEWSKGCVITLPIERSERWEIACIYYNHNAQKTDAVHYLSAGGSANILSALDIRNDQALVVWQGNNEFPRRIYAASVNQNHVSKIQAVSTKNISSSNPDVIFLDDGKAFAAWDSFDGENVNIHGCYYENGSWNNVLQLTSDPRIERHVHLAAGINRTGMHNLWMTWQAQSFKKHLINKFDEQRVVVAKINENNKLCFLNSVFKELAGKAPNSLYMHPRILQTTDDRLILTARHSLDAHKGWESLAWQTGEQGLSSPITLWKEQGRWRPIPMAICDGKVVAACQRDNLPRNWGIETGKSEDWTSEVVLVPVTETERKQSTNSMTSAMPMHQPFSLSSQEICSQMPPTDFSLINHVQKYSAGLPRQRQMHNGSELTLYWGDMHEHSDLSVCQRSQNPPVDDLWANQRDIEMLDFTAITDHGYNMDHPQWAYSSERVRAHFDSNRFISLLGEEWTSDHVHYDPPRSVKRYGHHNLIYQDAFFPKYYDSRDEPAQSPTEVWNDIGDAEFISIPHQLADTGNNPTDWTHHDEHHQPLAEIFQQRESYEYLGAPRQSKAATPFKGHFLQDAWAMGLIIGIIASPDHGGSKGKAGVWAEDLSRESLFKAFHARHTFGTSGAKMSLFVSSVKQIMGDKTTLPKGDIPFTITACADRPIAKVVIIRNNEEIYTAEPNSRDVNIGWTDKAAPKDRTLWYYVRIHRDDEELAWSSPIWFFTSKAEMYATKEHALNLTHLHPHGPPADDPGPSVNWRKKLKTKPGKH
ncbi:MAG: DUF3604 domain-containing protein [Kiritimatiellae bacterium]|jgi:hypothetical protein|nr:DUF3604 domain-containing protein [Kiritimatiellia bacterium]